ncbi:hypothetical protein D6C78_10646 [Aureobasidium pullulans]|uniref:Uncharacterized protein n=1 Tax=Aureobasidium pullulans TaxID=5580 RepID=A0A4T0BBX7_AURPU|nr:hypothetical protein D6C78_10646 [Aureobasidium pullulans]
MSSPPNYSIHDHTTFSDTGPSAAYVPYGTLLRAAPAKFGLVYTAQSDFDANELAYKAAFIWKRSMKRGGHDGDLTTEELALCMRNQEPGSPSLSILSFKSRFHDRMFGLPSTSRSKAIHKIDIPAFGWPQADFPQLRNPWIKSQERMPKNSVA